MGLVRRTYCANDHDLDEIAQGFFCAATKLGHFEFQQFFGNGKVPIYVSVVFSLGHY